MNWKLIIGILLIFGAVKEFISIRLDFADGKIIDPIAAELGTLTLGSVMEQIWEQISKAKIVLANLTDKNPNVFYELGLAHAAIKPVIFVSSKLEDIPFDLRHLRVIIYEIRDPNWGEVLKKNISDYLRNANKEPEKSIPHPFRASFENKQHR